MAIGITTKIGRTYRVGDIVKLLPQLPSRYGEPEHESKGYVCTPSMAQYQGRIATILGKATKNTYRLDVDDARFFWTTDWFDQTPLSRTQKQKNIEKIRLLEDMKTQLENEIKTLQEDK